MHERDLYTLLYCSSFQYSMKCQYFVAFILITICSRIILFSFLYGKERRDPEESKMQPRDSSQLSYFQRYTLLQCSSFHYSMKCQYFVAFILITICSRIILFSFLYGKKEEIKEKKEETQRNPMQPRNSSQLSYFQRYTLFQCSSFHYSMKCQYFVAFILITICSRIILFSFLYGKERRDQEESENEKGFILAIIFPEIHSVILFFISIFHEMSIFCCFYTHNYMFPNNFIQFSLWKRKKRSRGIRK